MGSPNSNGDGGARSRITINDGSAPVYVVRIEGVPTGEQFDAYLRQLTDIVLRPGPRALIFDATTAGPTPAAHRKKQAEWMKRFENETRATTVGTAFVLPSALMRGILTAILWLQPMACPHVIVATLAEGLEWARERLHQSVPKPLSLQ